MVDKFIVIPEDVKLISTDVFDTLLLRTQSSERSRIARGEELFSKRLAALGYAVAPDLLFDARREAQRLAFRARNVGGPTGEVRLEDVVRCQLIVLGLPEALVAMRLRIEIEVEKGSLFANRPLAETLRAHRRAGTRVVAISDTTLAGRDVAELIDHFHGPDLIDRVYSSADLGLTKRDGELFLEVARCEGVDLGDIIHLGDDPHADIRVPSSKGLRTQLVPRPSHRSYLRRADGALTQARRSLRGLRGSPASAGDARPSDRHAFGRAVFGPIVAKLSVLIWLYAAQSAAQGTPVLLFCARGGIGIREAFERTLRALALPHDIRCETLLVSRLVAARAAILARSDSAAEEIAREFRDMPGADIANALGGRAYDLSDDWHRTFTASDFLNRLFSPSGAEVLADIQAQNALFSRHLEEVAAGADRLILCDTGLYGSTQRLLAEGFPERRFETIQFARSNYKGHSESHFPFVTGLLVEERAYTPLNPASAVLRYWQLVESLFEPAIPSVRLFASTDGGGVTANCGPVEPGALPPDVFGDMLLGALSYIDDLPLDGGAMVLSDAQRAARVLQQMIARPRKAEIEMLGLAARSVDFGRPGTVDVLASERVNGLANRLRGIRSQLWREGAIARDFPILKHALLPAVSSAHLVRSLWTKRSR